MWHLYVPESNAQQKSSIVVHLVIPKTDTISHVRCSFGGTAGLLEKRDFIERLQELRDKAKDVQNGTLPPPKAVSAPTPTVPSAKDVMPIDPNLTDEDIEAMSLAEIKEVLKFHGAGERYMLCLPSISPRPA